ncbi:cytochrome P450 [Arthrobacter sp. U41]|uniref:cytochrome P450 n=1 Tax=Arthrobacter sp. U41 TaxID=1849032 RepID=UPI0008594343|nr:cytochrome P450 [Arthrobacter sp. U41]AOT04771.1 hypothetical protein ASPU41_17035 [Arthrobacter sp. U41]
MGGHIARMWKDGLLSKKEAKELCDFVFVAGHDTTAILLANAFRAFSEQPELLERIRRNPEDANLFVEELARYRGTVQRASRITIEEVDVTGVRIPAGAIVRLLPAAANRDSNKYPDGETFDIDRNTPTGTGAWATVCTAASARRWRGWRSWSRCSSSPRSWPPSSSAPISRSNTSAETI